MPTADRHDRAREVPLGRLGARAYDALGLLGGVVLAVMTLAVFVQVVVRFVGAAIEGLDEAPRYLFVWLVMIGAAAAMHRGEHTTLEYFRDRFRRRTRAVLSVVTNLAGILLFLSMIKTSFVLVPTAQLQSSPALNVPLGYVYAAIPVGSALILVPLAWRLVVAVRELWPKRS